jgi:hypothetical protein
MAVIRLLQIKKKLIINAAVRRSFLVFSIRSGLLISGINATPVSKPERPKASFGNTSSERPMIRKILRVVPVAALANSAVCQSVRSDG